MIPDYSLPPALRGDDGACLMPPPPLSSAAAAPYPYLYHPQDQQQAQMSAPLPLINTECLPDGMTSDDAAAICDFDRLVRHQDFAKILSSAAKLKNLQCQGSSDPALNPTAKTPGIMNLALSDLHSEKAASIVRENTVTSSSASSTGDGAAPSVLPRGLFPYTDALVDETIGSLVVEFDRCRLMVEAATAAGDNEAPSSNKKARKKPPPAKGKKKGNASQSIAVKYSKEQTDILTEWMMQNRSHPFPDQNQIQALSEAAGLTYSQVVNWTTNVRKRNLKATVEHGKKPHHFLDFLFLADDREKKMLGGEPLSALTSAKGRKNTSATTTSSSSSMSSPKRRQQANSTKTTRSKAKAKAKMSSATGSKSQQQSRRYKSDPSPMNEEEMPPLEATVAIPPPLVSSAPVYQPNSMPPPNSLPPPLPGKMVLPYPPMPYPPGSAPFQGAYPPHCGPPGHPHPMASGGMHPPPPVYPYPRPPLAASAQPLPMDTDAEPDALAGSISPPYQQTQLAGTYDVRQATITPSSSTSPTECRRNTGDSLDEALNFWNSGGLFSTDDIRNDAVLQRSAEEEEREAILQATRGGLVSTPPPREDDGEETGAWLCEESDILKSFEDNGSGSGSDSLKRSSITESAMLPMARNEKARRLSSLGTTLASLGYNPEIFTSAMAADDEYRHGEGGKRLSGMSLPEDHFAEAMSTPLPMDDDCLVREFLEENGAVQI